MCTIAVLLALFAQAAPSGGDWVFKEVSADRVYYEPGETAQFTVTAATQGKAPRAATLRVELLSDLEDRTSLFEGPVTLTPGRSFLWKGTAQMLPVLGLELRATLLEGGKAVATGRDFFTCARSVHQVMIHGRGDHGGWQFSGLIDAQRDAYPTRFAKELHATYGNYCEKFGWAPSDFDKLTPEEDRWWAGQTGYNESKTNMKLMIEAFHRQGIRVLTYGKAAGGGIAGYELLRRYPERPGYTEGRPWLENYDAAALDYVAALGPPHPGEKRMVPGHPLEMEKDGYRGVGKFQPFVDHASWCAVWYPCTSPEVADVGIDELAGSARMFGFDGVRFDGEFGAVRNQNFDGSWNLPENADVEAANVALVRRMKEKCWKAKPGYLFGYNSGTEVRWSIAQGTVPPSFREKCKDDGLVANENFAFPGDVPWVDYCLRVRREAEIVRAYGGHYATYAFNRSGGNLYNFIYQFALRAHIMACPSNGAHAWVNRAATRFAKLLWDDSLSTWHAAPDSVEVTAKGGVAWKEFAAIGANPAGGTRQVIHLFNPPESKTTFGKTQSAAAPLKEVAVRWKNLNDLKHAWIVDMPEASSRSIEPTGGEFRVGDVAVWKILVVDTAGPPPKPTYDEPSRKEAKGPSAQDLQIAPAVPKGGAGWQETYEPESSGGGEGTADREADPGAHNGMACVGKPGRPPGSMSYTYQYPSIPGRYRATFRLKVDVRTVDQPIFEIFSALSQGPPFPGIAPLLAQKRVIKASDFRQPNVYQDFSVEFEYADYGFTSCGANYLGHVRGSWDCLTLTLIERWSNARLAEHYKGCRRPEGLIKPTHQGLNVLAVRGLYNRLYRIDEAVGQLKGARLIEAYTSYNPQAGTTVAGYKWTWEDLWKLDVIVLANVETRGLNYGQVFMLSEWIKDGGGLVILGGNMTLGQSGNMDRGWPAFLPVELHGPWEIRRLAKPIQLSQSSTPPVVLYRHLVSAKPGSTTLLSGTQGEPLAVGGISERGRVAVFTGTVLGTAPAGARGFWESQEWPSRLAHLVAWAVKRER